MVVTGFHNSRACMTALSSQRHDRYNYHTGGKGTKIVLTHRDMWEWLMMIMSLEWIDGQCYGLNACVCSKFIRWNPNLMSWGPLGGGWFGHQRACMNRTMSLEKRPQRAFFSPLPCKDEERRWPSMNQAISRHRIFQCPDLVLSRTVRNKYSLFKSPSPWYFCSQSLKRLRQGANNGIIRFI